MLFSGSTVWAVSQTFQPQWSSQQTLWLEEWPFVHKWVVWGDAKVDPKLKSNARITHRVPYTGIFLSRIEHHTLDSLLHIILYSDQHLN